MYFYTRENLGLISVTLLSQRFPLVKELKNILIGPSEFVFYQHAIYSVKLTKIFGVESVQSSSSPPPPPPPPPPNQKLLPTPLQMNDLPVVTIRIAFDGSCR